MTPIYFVNSSTNQMFDIGTYNFPKNPNRMS